MLERPLFSLLSLFGLIDRPPFIGPFCTPLGVQSTAQSWRADPLVDVEKKQCVLASRALHAPSLCTVSIYMVKATISVLSLSPDSIFSLSTSGVKM